MTNLLQRTKGRSQSNPLSVHYVPRSIYMHTVSEDDLETLAGSGAGLYLTVLGICLGAFVSIFTTLETVRIINAYSHASFVAMAWLSGFCSLIAGLKVYIDQVALSAKLRRYKDASKKMDMTVPSGEPIRTESAG